MNHQDKPTPKTFTKPELFAELEAKACAAILAAFPPPEDFEFIHYKRNGAHSIALRVGNRVTKRHKHNREDLWLEDFQYDSDTPSFRPPLKYRGEMIGQHGGFAGFDFIHAPAYGSEAKCERTRQQKFIGLLYTSEDGNAINGKVYNSKSIKSSGIFEMLTPSGFSAPFTNQIKALRRFILLHCGYADSWEGFESATGTVQCIDCLARALRKIAKHAVLSDCPADGTVADDEYTEKEDLRKMDTEKADEAMSVPEGYSRKRLRDEDNESTPRKKVCSANDSSTDLRT